MQYISPHQHLHADAANVAEDPTYSFFEGLRKIISVKKFGEFLHINIGRSLSIAMNATGSTLHEAAKGTVSNAD